MGVVIVSGYRSKATNLEPSCILRLSAPFSTVVGMIRHIKASKKQKIGVQGFSCVNSRSVQNVVYAVFVCGPFFSDVNFGQGVNDLGFQGSLGGTSG